MAAKYFRSERGPFQAKTALFLLWFVALEPFLWMSLLVNVITTGMSLSVE